MPPIPFSTISWAHISREFSVDCVPIGMWKQRSWIQNVATCVRLRRRMGKRDGSGMSAFYTLRVVMSDRVRPCAVFRAASDLDAECKRDLLLSDGSLSFLPSDRNYDVILRRASPPEIEAYLAWMRLRPGTSPPARDGSLGQRAERRRRSFYERLWQGHAIGS